MAILGLPDGSFDPVLTVASCTAGVSGNGGHQLDVLRWRVLFHHDLIAPLAHFDEPPAILDDLLHLRDEVADVIGADDEAAFSRAKRSTIALGCSPEKRSSSQSGDREVTSKPAALRSAQRRGDPDAKTSLLLIE